MLVWISTALYLKPFITIIKTITPTSTPHPPTTVGMYKLHQYSTACSTVQNFPPGKTHDNCSKYKNTTYTLNKLHIYNVICTVTGSFKHNTHKGAPIQYLEQPSNYGKHNQHTSHLDSSTQTTGRYQQRNDKIHQPKLVL